MKKRVIILSITLIAATFLSVFSIIYGKTKEKEQQKAFAATIPSFSSSKVLTDFKLNTPSVFIAFHPECEHCQYEAKSLNERQHDLEKAQIVMFTSEKDSLTKVFSHSYGLDTVQNIKVISDEKNELYTAFGVKTIPSIFIYNKAGKLVKQYKGETKIDAIIKALND